MKRIFQKCAAALCAVVCFSAALTLPASAATSSRNDSQMKSFADQVLILINQERASYGLEPLYTTTSLQTAAAVRAEECLQSFSHTRPDGTSCFTILSEYNISYMLAGENIAYGQPTPQDVVNSWMASEGHRANILNADYDYIGVGTASDNTMGWSNLFVGGVTLDDATIPTEQGVKGDVDYDGKVSTQDAYLTLMAYSRQASGLQVGMTQAQIDAADIDGDGSVSIQDAYCILLYYAYQSAGDQQSWSDILNLSGR